MATLSNIMSGSTPLEHRAVTGCMMTVLPCCCSCADKRPQAAAYPVYVDGKGIRMQGKRWQRYCRKCHGKCTPPTRSHSLVPPPSSLFHPDFIKPINLIHVIYLQHIDHLLDYWQSLAQNSNSFVPIETSSTSTSTSSTSAMADISPVHARYQNRHENLLPPHENGDHPSDPTMSVNNPAAALTSHDRQLHNGMISSHTANTREQGEPVYPLGSREDVQQDDYESPLAGMFGRAYGRYREAEAARQAAQADGYEASFQWTSHGQFTTVYRPLLNPLFDPASAIADQQTQANQARFQNETNLRLDHTRNLARQTMLENVTQASRRADTHSNRTDGTWHNQTPAPFSTRRRRQGFHRQFYTSPLDTPFLTPQDNLFDVVDSSTNPIDAQLSRPSPSKPEDLKVDFACKVCTEQKINTVCMPCMHPCMCRWCAEIHKSDCRDLETGRWNNALWKCPICRKQITEVKRFYI